MGAGKSTAAKFLSNHYLVYDLDDVIEKVSGLLISDIFKYKGEDFFREIESKIFDYLLNYKNLLICLGGGTLYYYNNKNKLKKNCHSIFLYSPLKILWERVQNSERPLIFNYDNFEKIYFERLPCYLKYSDIIIDTSLNSWEEKVLCYIKILKFSQKIEIVDCNILIEDIKKLWDKIITKEFNDD